MKHPRLKASDARLTLDNTTIQLNGMDVAIVDQLINLMHLCDANELDFASLVDQADQYHTREKNQ